ncbi:MAG TPA: BlaI/MecI/CopY family transcriptional regulator [Planctomycetota bacterium]|nr:BlaI/MecI/CopY family transcriptional regulator [Planctomycetota bacterium]
MKRERPPPSDAEWKVLHALWRRHPANARELLDALGPETGWAYTTLKTVLSRMLEKGLVSAEMRGNTTWYEPAVEQGRARRNALQSLIERVFEGAAGPLLAHLVEHESLSPAERKQLAAWIAAAEKKGGRRGGR